MIEHVNNQQLIKYFIISFIYILYIADDSASTNGYASNFMSVFDNYAVAVQGSNLNVSVDKPDVYNGNTIYEHPVSGHPVATSVEQDVACSIDEQHVSNVLMDI